MTAKSASEIERDAQAADLTMKQVCLKAGVAYSTFWRWKNKGSKITLDAHERLQAAIRELGEAA